MPYANKDKQKEYENNNFHRLNIRIVRNDENDELVNNLNEAAKDKGITLPKYAILAIKEKLERDGYI